MRPRAGQRDLGRARRRLEKRDTSPRSAGGDAECCRSALSGVLASNEEGNLPRLILRVNRSHHEPIFAWHCEGGYTDVAGQNTPECFLDLVRECSRAFT